MRLTLLGLYQAYVTANPPPELFVKPGEAIAYAGFYRPQYAETLARAVGPEGRVVLIEADPRNYVKLVNGIKNIEGKERIETINRALWRESGTVPFEIYDDSEFAEYNKITTTGARAFYASSEKILEVPTITFDEVFEMYPEICHVFVTINGAELEAIKGMEHYLSTPGRSTWIKSPFVAESTGEPMIHQVSEELTSRGLRVFLCRQGDMRDGGGKVFAFKPY